MQEGCAYASLWRWILWCNLKLASKLQHFFRVLVWIVPFYPLVSRSFCSCEFACWPMQSEVKGHAHPQWEGTHLLFSDRSSSSLSAALTADKGILHIWQNISRVTFRCSAYVLWKIKSWARLLESFAKRGRSRCAPCGLRRREGDSGRIPVSVVRSSGEGQCSPAQVLKTTRCLE